MDDHFVQLLGADAHGACLLGHDAFGALAGDGVDFEEEELVPCCVVDVVETDYAAAVEEVVKLGGGLLYLFCYVVGAFGWCYFVAEALVFGLVVKEFVVADGDDFGDGEDEFLFFGAEHSAVEFASGDAFFDEDLAVFSESLLDGRDKLFGCFDFGSGYTAASCGGLDEEGVGEVCGVEFVERVLREVVDEYGTGNVDDAEAFDHGVAVSFVESECRGVESTGCVGNAEHVEVALEDTVLAGVSMDDDEGQVEVVDTGDGEVVAVDGSVVAVVGEAVPSVAVDDDFVDVVFLMVEVFVYLASATY